MAGYIGSKIAVTQVDGYNRTEADAEFVNDPNAVITVSGSKVGIGTTSPAQKLDVSGSIAVSDTTTSTKRLQLDSGASSHTINSANYGSDMMDLNIQAENLIFNTGLIGVVERMRIDSAGRVTMPYQAAFSAHKNGNQALAAHTPTKITGFSTIFENQSGWNSSTNRYTAPVAGVYLIHLCIQSSVTGGLHVRVDRNGSNGWNGDSYLDYGDTSGGDNTYFAKLNANDYLEFYAYLTSAGNVNANRTRISVVLLG